MRKFRLIIQDDEILLVNPRTWMSGKGLAGIIFHELKVCPI
jgi:hypothetical protein